MNKEFLEDYQEKEAKELRQEIANRIEKLWKN